MDRSSFAFVLNALYQHVDSMVVCLSRDKMIVSLNHQAEHVLGLRLSEVKDKPFLELCPQFPYPDYFDSEKPLKKSDLSWKITTGKGKLLFSLTLVPVLGEDESSIQYLLIGRDITERVNAQSQMEEVNQRLNSIINHLPHFIFWKDSELRFLGCNRLFAEAAGYQSVEDVIGKTDFELAWGENKALAKAYCEDDRRVMETRTPKLNYEELQIQKDGAERTMLVSKVPLINGGPKVKGILGIYTDITERKAAEVELEEAKEAAESANLLKTEFIRDVQHDIRTPFSGIWGVSHLLLERETDPSKKQDLSDLSLCAKELMDYCSTILDFSRIEDGMLPVIDKRIMLRKLVEDIFAMEKPAAKVKTLSLIEMYDAEIPEILIGDPYRIQRILLNLVSNAIKFTNTGSITLSVDIDTSACDVAKDDRKIIIKFQVSDTGIGISPDKVDLIYERFTRLSPSHKGIYRGQGLGLRVVKQFVEELGADIHVKSEEGEGSTFTVLMPLKLPLSNQTLDDKDY